MVLCKCSLGIERLVELLRAFGRQVVGKRHEVVDGLVQAGHPPLPAADGHRTVVVQGGCQPRADSILYETVGKNEFAAKHEGPFSEGHVFHASRADRFGGNAV